MDEKRNENKKNQVVGSLCINHGLNSLFGRSAEDTLLPSRKILTGDGHA
jgi:hypothetical protein